MAPVEDFPTQHDMSHHVPYTVTPLTDKPRLLLYIQKDVNIEIEEIWPKLAFHFASIYRGCGRNVEHTVVSDGGPCVLRTMDPT